MALTKEFRETVKDRAERDPEFRRGLLTEAMEAVVRGELDVAKILLRDYKKATEGFETVGKAVDNVISSLEQIMDDKIKQAIEETKGQSNGII